MINSKLLDIWRKLDNKQLKRLGLFIKSPFFNTNTDLVLLADYIMKYAPKFSRKKALNKEEVCAKAFDGKKIGITKLNHYISYLLKLSEQFLVVNSIKDDDFYYQDTLLTHYNQWQLEKHFRQVEKDAEQLLYKSTIKDADYYYHQYQLEHQKADMFSRKRLHQYDDSLVKMVNSLDTYYLSLKLQYSCQLVNRQNVLRNKDELIMLDELLAFLDQQNYEHIPCVALYHQVLKTLLESENEHHFEVLKQKLRRDIGAFSPQEAYLLYTYAINYAIRRINKGDTQYQIQLFDLYVEMLEQEILFYEGTLSPWAYNNVVSVALRVGKVQWASQFISDYQAKLPQSFKETAYYYNLAYLRFMQQDYWDALFQLQQVAFSDVFYSLNSKTLMLKVYYELKQDEALYAHIHAFKVYLKRNKSLTENSKAVYINLFEFTRLLFKYQEQQLNDKIEQLKQTVVDTKHVADINWLLQKINAALHG